ncbi:MAG: hypothetical protein IJO96_01390 [Oscillospiraceae bacterium]|nr:hypothetical protein [Oscillospiraceae bacterium]
MTETEKIAYAKSFIDNLANGINPLDGTPVKEDDIVNNIRISRCFFFVSDVLRQVIENGGVTKKRSGHSNFYLSPEQLAEFAFSDAPLTVTEIVKALNSLITDETMRKLSTKDITGWLVSVGMLYEITGQDGKTLKRPTEQGKEVGIDTEARTGQYGEYLIVTYNKAAQTFIVDNLDAVLALKYGIQ